MKISLWLILIAVFALAVVMSGLLTIAPFEFAGFNWQDSGTILGNPNLPPCNVGGGSGNVERDGEFLNIWASSGGESAARYVEADVTGIDELLIIYEGYGEASCQNGRGNSGAGISAQIVGSDGGSAGSSQSIGTSTCPSYGSSASTAFKPAIWKLKNNFDGTWSSLESIGVGDIFIVKDTSQINGKPKLRMQASAGNGCGNYGSGKAFLKVYNVIRKENAFALCKADKYAFDLNKDGKIATDGSECLSLDTIVLNSEEAIKESFDEKLARITLELEAKNAGLTADIEALKKQLAEVQATPHPYDDAALQEKINALQTELKETKAILADVQAGDRNVIATIEQQERFKKPNFISELFNKIIAFFKNLFR